MCALSIKVPIRKKYGNLFNDPRRLFVAVSFIYIYLERVIYIYIYIYGVYGVC